MPPPPTVTAAVSTDGEAGTTTIAEAAERTGVTAHTLRYYERAGLLEVGRDRNDRRRYTDADLGRITFITRMRQSEMPVRDIRRYVELVRQGPATEPERLALLEDHRASVRRRLGELTDALAVIDFKITVYGGATGDPGDPSGTATCGAP